MTRQQHPGYGDSLDPIEPDPHGDPADAEPRRERQQDSRLHRAEISREADHGRHGEDRSRPPTVVRKSR